MAKGLRGNEIYLGMLDWGEAYPKVKANPHDITANLENGYGPLALKAFRAYLGKKYVNIQKLNNEWQTDYKNFDEIKPPEAVENRIRATPLIYEFEKFRLDSWVNLWCEVIKKFQQHDPEHAVAPLGMIAKDDPRFPWDIQTTNILCGGFGTSHSPFLTQAIGAAELHYRPNRPLMCYEFNVLGDEYKFIKDERILRRAAERSLWQHCGWGISTAFLYSPSDQHVGAYMSVEDDLKVPKYCATAIPLTIEKLNRMRNAFLNTTIVTPHIAFIRSSLEEMLNPERKESEYVRKHNLLIKEFYKAHYPYYVPSICDIESSPKGLSEYQVAYIANKHMEGGFSEKLLSYVKNGGVLIISGPAGLYNKFGQTENLLYRKIFGIDNLSKQKASGKSNAKQLLVDNTTIDIGQEQEFVWYPQYKQLLDGVDVMGYYDNGVPAVFRRKYGKGIVLACLVPFGRIQAPALHSLVISEIERQLGPPLASADTSLVDICHRRDKNGNDLLIVTNLDLGGEISIRFVVDGSYQNIVDLCLLDGIPINAKEKNGMTYFDRIFQGGEGTVFFLGKPEKRQQIPKLQRLFTLKKINLEKKLAKFTANGLDVSKQQAKLKAANKVNSFCELEKIELQLRNISNKRAVSDRKEELKQLASLLADSSIDSIAKARIAVMLKCAEKAIDLKLFDKSEEYTKCAAAFIKSGKVNVRNLPIDAICPKLERTHVFGDFAIWKSIPEIGKITPDRAWWGSVAGNGDCSGTIKIAWDDKNLYVLLNVQDDTLVPEKKNKKKFNGDGIELYFNIMDDKGMLQFGGVGDGLASSAYGPDDFQFIISSEGKIHKYSPHGQGNSLGMGDVPGIKVATQKTSVGYQIEVAVPWKSMFIEHPAAGYTFGFNASINDLDQPENTLKAQLSWKYRQPCSNTTGWARIELGNTALKKPVR